MVCMYTTVYSYTSNTKQLWTYVLHTTEIRRKVGRQRTLTVRQNKFILLFLKIQELDSRSQLSIER